MKYKMHNRYIIWHVKISTLPKYLPQFLFTSFMKCKSLLCISILEFQFKDSIKYSFWSLLKPQTRMFGKSFYCSIGFLQNGELMADLQWHLKTNVQGHFEFELLLGGINSAKLQNCFACGQQNQIYKDRIFALSICHFN